MSSLLGDLRRDVAYGGRSLRRSAGFSALAVFTLAVGIGASTAMFSVLDGVLLRALPVRQQDALVVMWLKARAGGIDHVPILYRDLVAFARGSRALTSAGGVNFQGASDFVMRDVGNPVPLAGSWVTGNFFSVLGVEPVLGRTIQPSDDVVGAAPVMDISYGLWQRRFGGNRSAIGHLLDWNGKRYTIVGILPRGFEYPKHTDAWFAVVPWFPGTVSNTSSPAIEFDLVGRLRPGATGRQARADFESYLESTDRSRPADMRGQRAIVTPLPTIITGSIRPIIWTASAAVVLLLLIACINVTNLLLIRGSTRAQELAVRIALGADRRHLSRQLLIESGLLALAAGILGLALAALAVHVVVALAPSELPRRDVIQIDLLVLVFALAITLAAMMLSGLLPAILSASGDLHAWLHGGSSAAIGTRRTQVVRHGLVVGQVALAVLVAVGAGLLVRSLVALETVDLAFNPDRLLVLETILPPQADSDRTRQLALEDEMVSRVAAIPGVIGASTMPKPPFSAEGGWFGRYTGQGQSAEAQAGNPLVNVEVVGPDYFRTLQIRLLQGRVFGDADREQTSPVAVVSEAIASRSWPGEDPIGKQIKLGALSDSTKWMTVVGVVGDTRYHELTKPQPSLYIPARQDDGIVPMTLAVRTRGDPAALMPEIQRTLKLVNPALAVAAGGPMQQLLAVPLAQPRFSTLMLTLFALITLLLASVGIYGALATAVSQRSRELGIRIALGAAAGKLYALVLRQGMRLAVIGCALGLVGAIAATRALKSILFDVAPTDPPTFAAIAALVLVSAALACYLPARRATRADPLVTLRGE